MRAEQARARDSVKKARKGTNPERESGSSDDQLW